VRTKCAAHGLAPSRAAFRRFHLRERVRQGYDDLARETRVVFVPFDEALAVLDGLVRSLTLAEA